MSMDAIWLESRSSKPRNHQLSIICSVHSCLFNYVQLSLEKSFRNKCETCWSLYGEKPVTVATFPYPFYNFKDVEYDLIIVPGAKDSSFTNSIRNLHIAVAHKSGLVLDFDRPGLDYKVKEDVRFQECLRLHLNDELIPLTVQRATIERCWDDTVSKYLNTSERDRWLSDSYQTDSNNCFDFVLHFVETLFECCGSDASHLKSKDVFCNRLVKARIEGAALYLSLRKSIVDDSPVFIGREKAKKLISYLDG